MTPTFTKRSACIVCGCFRWRSNLALDPTAKPWPRVNAQRYTAAGSN